MGRRIVKDENKTKAQLVAEMVQLRQRIAELEEVGDKAESAQQALGEWQTTFDAMSDWVCLVEPATHRILCSNRHGEEMLGLPLAQIVGQSCCRLLHESDEPLPGCPARESLRTLQRAALEIQVPHVNRWLLVTADPIIDDTGEVAAVIHVARDITEWKRAEESLRQQSQDLALMNRIDEAVNRGDSFQDVTELLSSELSKTLPCNGATLYLLSDDREHLVIQNLTLSPTRKAQIEKLIRTPIPEVRIRLKEGSVYRRILDDGHAQVINDPETITGLMAECTENRLLKKLVGRIQTVLDIHSVISVPLMEDGSAVGLLDVSRSEPFSEADVARLKSIAPQLIGCLQRMRTENALRESEERFRYLSEAAFEGIIIHDSGILLAANDQYYEMFGFEPGELVGKQVIPLTVAPEAEDAMREQIAGGSQGPYESIGLRRDGTGFPMEIRARGMSYEGREVRVATVLDVTDRRRADEALRQSEERYRELANSITDVFFAMDEDLRYTFWNQASEHLTGIPAQDAIGKSIVELFPDSENTRKAAAVYGEVLSTQRPRSFVNEYRLRGRDYSFEISAYPSGSGLSVFAKDITERTRAETEIRQRNEELRALMAIAETLSSSLNLEEVLDSALSKVLEILGVEAGGVYLVDETSRRLTLKARHGVSEEFVSQVGEVAVDEDTIARATEMSKAGKLILATELLLKDRTLLKRVTTAIAREKLRSYRQAIIRSKGAPAGLLVIATRDSRKFTPREEQLLSAIAHQMGLAIENVRLYEEQVNKVFQMDALRKTTLDITSQLDLDTVLRSIAARAVQLLGGTAGGLYLYRPETDLLEWTVPVGEGLLPIGTTRQRGEGLSGRVWETGQPLIVDDYLHWEGRSHQSEGRRAEAQVGVPVHWQDKFLGVLNVLAYSPRTFGPNDADLLSLFAGQAAIAIENARLYDEARKRAEELALLNRVTTATASSLELQDVLEAVSTEMATAFGVEQCGLALLDDTTQQLTIVAEYLAPGRTSALGDVIPVRGNPSTERVLETGRALAITDARGDPLLAPVRHLVEKRGTKSLLIVPLTVKSKVIGTIGVDFAGTPHGFTPEEIALAESIAGQAAVAIENAQLYEGARDRLVELSALQAISLRLTQSLDSAEVLDTVASSVLRLFQASDVQIFLYDRENDELSFATGAWTEPDKSHRAYKAPRQDGLTARVARTGRPLLIEDTKSHPLFANYEAWRPDLQVIGSFPLKARDQVIGVVNMAFDSGHAFDEHKLRLAELLADQAAIAIENARLYAEQERTAREMTALYETSLDISGRPALTDVLRSIMNRGVELLHARAGSVWLYSHADNDLELVVDYGVPETYVGGRMRIGEGVSGKVFASRQAMAVEDYRHWEGRSGKFSSDVIGGMLGVPLMWGDQAIGVLNVNEIEKPRKFTEQEVRLLSLFANQAAVAIQNARLHEEQERRATEMTALYETSLDITGRLALTDVLRSIMNRGVELLHTGGGAVWLYRPEEEQLELVVDYGHPESYVGGRMKTDEGVSGKVFLSGQAMAVEDYRHWYGRSGQFDSNVIGGMLGVPLMWGEQAIGVLNVNEIEKSRKFTEQEVRLLSLFANQAAVAIQNARLHEEQERRAEEMTALYDTALDISGRLELPDVLGSIMTRGVQLLGASGAAIWLYRPDDKELEFIMEHGGLGIHVGERVKLGEGLAGKALQTGEPTVVEDYRQWDGRLPQLDSGTVGGMVGVPLLWGEQPIGVLEVYEAEKPRRFTEEEVRLLTLFGNQAAVAIQNARLYEETRRREDQLAALHDVSLEIAGELDLTVLLKTVVQGAIDLLGGPSGGLYLYRLESQELERVVHLGSGHDYLGVKLRLGEGACGKAAQTGQPLVVLGYADWEGRSRKFEAEGNLNVLAVPISHGESLLGALYVNDSNLERDFDEADIRVATMFANQAAIALENARLHDEQRQRAQELGALHETALDITRHLDLDSLLAAVIARATRLLDAPSGDVYLYRPDSDDLQNVASLGMPLDLRGRVLKRGEGLTGRVFETGEPAAVEDYETWDGRSEQYVGYGFSRALAAPLRYGARSVGVLVIDRPASAPPFTERETNLLTLFANQAAIAIENARLLAAVAQHKENLQGLSSRLIDAQEQERKRIAQELHDEMGQALTAMSINLSAIDKAWGARLDPDTAERLAETDSLITRTLEQMRELALDLRPSMLDDLGLLPALRWYVKRYENRTGIQVGLEVSGLEERPPEPIETVIYRVVQEALTNVARHAGASRVDIHLQRRDSIVEALIEDNGSGFDPEEVADREAAKRGVGLVGMRERIGAVGGSLEIKSRRGKGTLLAIQLPLS
jgi:PAS domain S-box-containing protein